MDRRDGGGGAVGQVVERGKVTGPKVERPRRAGAPADPAPVVDPASAVAGLTTEDVRPVPPGRLQELRVQVAFVDQTHRELGRLDEQIWELEKQRAVLRETLPAARARCDELEGLAAQDAGCGADRPWALVIDVGVYIPRLPGLPAAMHATVARALLAKKVTGSAT